MKKATFKDLVARKRQKEESLLKFKEIEVKSMEKSLIFKKPSDDMVLDVMDGIGTSADTRAVTKAYKKLIYMSCDALQDTELHKELDVIDPLDTVDAIFDLSDILTIGEELFEFSGIGSIGEEVKKS
ncbi:MAG: hypothetical protein ACK5MV_10525 [Aminipila sp.]